VPILFFHEPTLLDPQTASQAYGPAGTSGGNDQFRLRICIRVRLQPVRMRLPRPLMCPGVRNPANQIQSLNLILQPLDRTRPDACGRRSTFNPAGGVARRDDHLSNFGMIGGALRVSWSCRPGGDHWAGRAEQRVVVDHGRPAIHRMLPLSLTFDHRA